MSLAGANIANLVLPASLPAPGRFEFLKSREVLDVANGATFRVSGSVEPDHFTTTFKFETLVIKGALYARAKYPDRPMIKGAPENPGSQIIVGAWVSSFRLNHMIDREFNSRLVLYILHMIAFRNAVSLSHRAFLWSDYNLIRKRCDPLPFDMPSDDDLLTISAAW